MSRIARICCLTALALSALLAGGERATAGRVGGPAAAVVTLGPFEEQTVYVPFAAGEQAIVTVSGPGTTNVELLVHDGDGNVTGTDVIRGSKVAVVNVYRAGLFRVEVRNIGPIRSTVIVRTN